MIDFKQVQNGGVEIGPRDWIVHRIPTDFIGRPVSNPRFQSPARHPNRKAFGIVIASHSLYSRGRDERPWQRDYGVHFDDTPTPTGSSVIERNLARPTYPFPIGDGQGTLVIDGGL